MAALVRPFLQKHFLALAVIGLMVATPSARAQEDQQEIIAYERQCKVRLELVLGTLLAARTLADDGSALVHNDTASWTPHRYGQPEPGISVGWFDYRMNGISYRKLSEVAGSVSLFFRAERKLPGVALWRFKRAQSVLEDSALAATIATGADKRLAGTKFSLLDILNFAGDAPNLAWTMERLPSRKSPGEVIFTGTTELAGLREAQAALASAAVALDTMQRDALTKCERTPVYYDPGSEI